jgi:N-acetylglucosaminyldiphosphoundecaprenol N-acetyl-beta-D-mannosaminyltransferase
LNSTINILGVNIINTSYEEFLTLLKEKLENRGKFTFNYVNVYILLTYNRNGEFKNYLHNFSTLLSDGIGVHLASRFLYGKNGLKERITGTDLYYKILEIANQKKLKCFFFGGSEKATKLLPGTLKDKYPGLIISGIIYRKTEFNNEIIERIRNSNADILFVGLGTPYQEEFISKYSNSFNIPVQTAIGSGIEFISGAKKRAPLFMRKFGFEWVYRIYLEPTRLWKRYIFGIPIFMFKVFKLKVNLLLKKQNN